MYLDKNNNSKNRVFATYNLPSQMEDFIDDYERSVNYASIHFLDKEMSQLNYIKLERDFYLRSANKLANIYSSKFSLSKIAILKQIIDCLEKVCVEYKEKFNKIIDNYEKNINVQELNNCLDSLISEMTKFCEMKFKSSEKIISQFDKNIENNKLKIKSENMVVFYVNIKELFKNNSQIKIFLEKMKDFKEEKQQTKILFNAGFKDAELSEEGTPYIFNGETLNKIRYIKNKLNEFGYDKILFSEYYSSKDEQSSQEWSYRAVIKSNKYISNIINKIKLAKHTPLEAMIFIHSIATLIPFSNNNTEMLNEDSPEILRTIVGMIENKEAVCSAYTHLVKAIVDGLDMSGLKAKLNCCYIKEGAIGTKFYKYLQGGNHAQNFIIIQDDKYKIKGMYRNDCSWDAIKLNESGEIEKGQTFTFFMNSIKDIYNLKNMVYKPFNNLKMKDYDTSYIKNFKGYKLAKIQTNLAIKELRMSDFAPISFDTFIDAFESTYKKLGLDEDFISRTIFKIVERSCDYAEKVFTPNSQNIFITLGKDIDVEFEDDLKKSL